MTHPEMTPELQVAVVGAGYWGPNIIRNLNRNSRCRLAAVCDKDTAKLSRLEGNFQHPVTLTTRYDELLKREDIDAVAIVTDIPTHYGLAKQALEAGKHVFVEKPLATTGKECLMLGELAEKAGKVLLAGHTFIYNPAVRKLKEIVTSGELGKEYYLHAQRLNLGRVQVHYNALWSLAVHDISIALYLFDEMPERVRAWGSSFITPEVEDVVFVNLAFPSGRLANIHVSWLDPEKKRQVTVVGSKKMVVYDDVSLDRKITIYDKGIDKDFVDTEHTEYKEYSGFQLLIRTGDVHIPHLKFSEPLQIEVDHFIDCMIKDTPPLTGWRQGYEVVKVLEAAQASINDGGAPVEIDWQEHSANVHA